MQQRLDLSGKPKNLAIGHFLSADLAGLLQNSRTHACPPSDCVVFVADMFQPIKGLAVL
jgi:hypothetical protein